MIIKTLSEPNKYSVWTATAWTVLILFLSFKAPSVNPKYIFEYQDKVVHFVFYFVFVFLWARFMKATLGVNSKQLRTVFLIAVLLSGGIELSQELLTVNRHAEWADMLANLLGAGIGGVFARFFLK